MPKLPVLTPQKVIRILERHGFILDRVRGSHHMYFNPASKKRAVVPLHKKEPPKRNASKDPETGRDRERRALRLDIENRL
jgi:predicted RNA binding protein YcfA (HicA-like mRNA interferase family)